MTSKTKHEEASLPLQSPPQNKKKKKIALILIVLLGGIIIAAIIISQMMMSGMYALTGYRITINYTTHLPSGNNTISNQENSSAWTVRYRLNDQFSINYPFYNNVSGGSTRVSNIVCNTPGFSFRNSSLPFPFDIPTAPNASTTNNNIIVQLMFNTPSAPYSGPLIFTIYMDYYL